METGKETDVHKIHLDGTPYLGDEQVSRVLDEIIREQEMLPPEPSEEELVELQNANFKDITG